MKITPIKAFTDNYIWIISAGEYAAVVDPGDGALVFDYLSKSGLQLSGILITHHHMDHVGGIRELKKSFPHATVYGPARENIPLIDIKLKEDDTVCLSELGTYRVIDVPGHTAGHIAYYGEGVLFVGDTVFACGCGRLFEGTAAQMLHSLTKISKLPVETEIYCAHEYTLANIKFAISVDPDNKALLARQEFCLSLRQEGKPTVPFTLAAELASNPFFGCTRRSIQEAASRQAGMDVEDPVVTFSAIRSWKDAF